MTDNSAVTTYNAWSDPWLPLRQPDGSARWASPIEVLCGEQDGIDLEYPRDDFRVYGRLLLSALVQALFPARDKAELEQRLRTPLTRAEVEARIAPVRGDFDLFGPTPFLQVVRPANPPEKGAAPFVFPSEDLFRAQVPVDALAIPIALVTIFIEQTYAGGAGRGYGAGPGGQPGAFTLIDPGSIRLGAWANSLSLEFASRHYAPDGSRTWSNEKREAAPRASLGLCAGLFFQPRSIWLEPAGAGACSFSGTSGDLVRRSPYLPKSELARKQNGVEDLWRHPCAPLAMNSQGIGAIRLSADRPAWTGLAQLLRPLSQAAAKGKKQHPAEGPALVLQQWRTLNGRTKSPRLIVLDFDRDKANVRKRFFESLPLSEQLLDDEVVGRLRALSEDAQDIQRALTKALARAAHGDRRTDGLALADARSAFWAASEAPFVEWLAHMASVETWDDAADARAAEVERAMRAALRATARRIFDEHVSLSEFDARKQRDVAIARRGLVVALHRQNGHQPTETQEVRP